MNVATPAAEQLPMLEVIQAKQNATPLETITILAPTSGPAGEIVVLDGAGREYARSDAAGQVTFTVAGALGDHRVQRVQSGKVVAEQILHVDAQTQLKDSTGQFAQALDIFNKTMRCYTPSGVEQIQWHGQTYARYVGWILDHVHTAKGMYYFSDGTPGLVDMFRIAQKPDGMIWSFGFRNNSWPYYMNAYAGDGYAMMDDGVLFARQPVENHNEYNFVDGVYLSWKASGDDVWLKQNLDAAIKALDYSVTSPARFSRRFGLLKRGYTIDSWDFQVHDVYFVPMRLAAAQRIDLEKTKFGVFFGDNHGYAHACDQLTEMLEQVGRKNDAQTFRQRSKDIRERLDKLTWNGRFFTHHVEEDDSVKRDLGVDEKSQIAMSNAYALNRGIPHDQAVAILETYLDLKSHLPQGSPGEWYAIYPPFGKGFGADNARWEYMNGGVHGHAAGELARGAFEHGYEQYGADILARLGKLGADHGGVIKFAYTGAVEPPPPAQVFTVISLAKQANMDLLAGKSAATPWMSSEDEGNDMRGLPIGRQTIAGVPYEVLDPAGNGRRAVIGVSADGKLPEQVTISLEGQKAEALYLLHTCGGSGSAGVAAGIEFLYDDGTKASTYLQRGKHLGGWWYPELNAKDAGIAWSGPNLISTLVGVYWAAIANPRPQKAIASITIKAALEGATYILAGLTLADRMPYHAKDLLSYGGPDNWAGGLCMAALVEGLAGIKDTSAAYRSVRLSPRWTAAGVDQVSVTARYPASQGYVSYSYAHDDTKRQIVMNITSSADELLLRILLPVGAESLLRLYVNNRPVHGTLEHVEKSVYATCSLKLRGLLQVVVDYQ